MTITAEARLRLAQICAQRICVVLITPPTVCSNFPGEKYIKSYQLHPTAGDQTWYSILENKKNLFRHQPNEVCESNASHFSQSLDKTWWKRSEILFQKTHDALLVHSVSDILSISTTNNSAWEQKNFSPAFYSNENVQWPPGECSRSVTEMFAQFCIILLPAHAFAILFLKNPTDNCSTVWFAFHPDWNHRSSLDLIRDNDS